MREPICVFLLMQRGIIVFLEILVTFNTDVFQMVLLELEERQTYNLHHLEYQLYHLVGSDRNVGMCPGRMMMQPCFLILFFLLLRCLVLGYL